MVGPAEKNLRIGGSKTNVLTSIDIFVTGWAKPPCGGVPFGTGLQLCRSGFCNCNYCTHKEGLGRDEGAGGDVLQGAVFKLTTIFIRLE